jgi:hypothetical protein
LYMSLIKSETMGKFFTWHSLTSADQGPHTEQQFIGMVSGTHFVF